MRKAKIIRAIIALVLISGITYLAIYSGSATEKIQTSSIKLQTTEEKLKDVNIQVEQLKTQSSTDKAKEQQLEKEKIELESQLQARADAKAALDIAAANAARKLTDSQTVSAEAVPVYSGSHEDWMAAAGISSSDYGYVDYIISHESGWNATEYNHSGSGAYGLGQALPASKMSAYGADYMTDPVTQLKWANAYAVGRYGSWAIAYTFWVNNNWW